MKQSPEDFLVGITDRTPLIGMGTKLAIMGLIILIAIIIVWWARKK